MNATVIGSLVGLRLRRVLKDRAGLVWLIVMPMVFSFLMGRLFGNWDSGPANRPVLLVFDQDGGPGVEELLSTLRNHEQFQIVRRDTAWNEVQVRDALERSRITGALRIPAGYTAALRSGAEVDLRLYYDSDRLSSQTIRTLLDRALLRANTLAAAETLVAADATEETPAGRARALDREEFRRSWEEPRLTLRATALGRTQSEQGLQLTSTSQHVGPAYTIFFVLMFLLMSAKDLVAERKDRTLARLVASRACAADLVLGFFLAGFTIGLLQTGILLALNSLAFGIDYGSSPAGLVLVVVLVAGVSSAASVLLGSLARTGAQADGLGLAITMILAALGGLWWPLEIVPKFMQVVGRGLPTGQAITVFHDMIGRGYGVAESSDLLLGLAVWFVLLLAAAVWRLRRLVAV